MVLTAVQTCADACTGVATVPEDGSRRRAREQRTSVVDGEVWLPKVGKLLCRGPDHHVVHEQSMVRPRAHHPHTNSGLHTQLFRPYKAGEKKKPSHRLIGILRSTHLRNILDRNGRHVAQCSSLWFNAQDSVAFKMAQGKVWLL